MTQDDIQAAGEKIKAFTMKVAGGDALAAQTYLGMALSMILLDRYAAEPDIGRLVARLFGSTLLSTVNDGLSMMKETEH